MLCYLVIQPKGTKDFHVNLGITKDFLLVMVCEWSNHSLALCDKLLSLLYFLTLVHGLSDQKGVYSRGRGLLN